MLAAVDWLFHHFQAEMLLVASTPVYDALLPIHKDEMFPAENMQNEIREQKWYASYSLFEVNADKANNAKNNTHSLTQ